MSERLYLEFCGEDWTLDAGESLSFGRSAELEIDDNPYLHRVVGRFVHRDGAWWLDNVGRVCVLEVRDTAGASAVRLAPGRSIAIAFGEFSCAFTAGPTHYELSGGLDTYQWADDLLGPDAAAGTATLEWGRVGLNDDQRLLLVAMCEPWLLDPGAPASAMLSNRQGAARLGWTVTKFNRKLDHLCEKLHRAGVAGVHGAVGANAADRRRHLVEHAVAAQLVTPSDLSLIDADRAA
jgi:hypothetical protein